MTLLYFAYGSNMLPARLKARCRSARFVGRAIAQNCDLSFGKRGRDGSGKATLTETSMAAISTPGVLYEIAHDDWLNLDHAEGSGYERVDHFPILREVTSEPVTASTYIARSMESHLKPFDWYLALVLAGAQFHDLCADHRRRLREIQHVDDLDHRREGRTIALRALAHHGHRDHRSLVAGDSLR